MQSRKTIIRALMIALLSITIVIVVLWCFNNYLDKKIQSIYNSNIERMYSNKNDYVLSKSTEKGNLILLGSSELSSDVYSNPVNMFPNKEYPVNITIDGVAYTQSLLHSMNIASMANSAKSDIAIIVSLQWFYWEEIDPNGFGGNFSEIQFWNTIYNDRIKKSNKDYICSRTNELLSYNKGYEDIKTFTFLYEKRDNIFAKIGLAILSPYYKGKYEILKIQDKYKTYITLKSMGKPQDKMPVKTINWDEEYIKANEIGENECTNNQFFVNNNYYDTYLRDNIEERHNESSSENLQSKEMQDFEVFLSICDDLEIEPFIVMMNTNGFYYDYIGIPSEVRCDLYTKVKKMAEKHGYMCLTMEDKEYEPYFMTDVMHLGWKGWVYVNEQITKHFAKS